MANTEAQVGRKGSWDSNFSDPNYNRPILMTSSEVVITRTRCLGDSYTLTMTDCYSETVKCSRPLFLNWEMVTLELRLIFSLKPWNVTDTYQRVWNTNKFETVMCYRLLFLNWEMVTLELWLTVTLKPRNVTDTKHREWNKIKFETVMCYRLLLLNWEIVTLELWQKLLL